MMRMGKLMLAAGLAAMPTAPALAGWKLVSHGAEVKVAKSALGVTPSEDWNRWSTRPIAKGEVWTLDGAGLNELYFVSGLAAGETLFKDARKKDAPLPKLPANAQLTDIPDFFESSERVGLNTSAFELIGSEPAKLGGRSAIRFTYRYAVEGSALQRKGVATATLENGQLTLIAFAAPETFIFNRDAPKALAVMNSARF
ncbi:MAG: hypothetical protein KGM17_03320 [Sphingomonadales bacterium]|nr:hypothetical protein [Sphingomonadales bacterium]